MFDSVPTIAPHDHDRYTRADAPELLALVATAKELLQIRAVWTDPHNDEICTKFRAALSAYEALK